MSGSKTGSKSIWRHAKSITRLYRKYGASDIDTITTEGTTWGDCIRGLVACVELVMLHDDQPLEIDRHAPAGPEDLPPA